ncbi:MAG: NrtA/SsuA/CpmA family ABC transporter substrate-binding protein [Methanomicrobiales archaeon]|nr:NrtA/SsuA/CpmA family ABC transporter substrate-binding protein [Methanomicrobiales archaeon]
MMNKTTIAVTVITFLALTGLGLWAWSQFHEGNTNSESMDSIVVAYSPFESTALFWIAEEEHFFSRNGLNITLRKYDSGAASLDGVVLGEADIAVGVTEFPLVRKAFQGEKIRTIGVIDKGYFTYLIARRDRGIEDASDLKGKRVGTTIGTIAEFHLGRFLTLHGMSMNDISLVDVKTPTEWVNAVADGDIDAISTAQPYADVARDRLGANAVIWSVQSSQPLFALIATSDAWITAHPELAIRFLRSITEAEEYLKMHPADSRSILQKKLDLNASYLDTVWQQNQFSLTLDQSLVLAMEDEARWMIKNNLTNATMVPDFQRYIYSDGLDAVKPGSVNIIR